MRIKVDLDTSGTPIHSKKLDTLEARVARLRGLPLKKPIEFVSFSEAAVRMMMMEEFTKETPPEELEADEKLYKALGLLPQDEDLKKTLIDVYTEQIAGFYDTETKRIVIVKSEVSDDVMDELTLSHEITHGIQDQNFDLEKPPLDVETYTTDNDMAVTSLIEGDATQTMADYAKEHIDPGKLAEAYKKSGEISTEELDKSPLYVRRSLMFPYEEGFAFDQALISEGGEGAVNSAYRDPPLSTRQVLHPEDYFGERVNPVPVEMPDLPAVLGRGWKMINSETLGEFDIQVWFEDFVGLIDSLDVSEGWAGNTVRYYQGPGRKYVVANETAWDSAIEAVEFADGYEELLDGRFGKKASKTGSGTGWYVYNADGELFYTGVSGRVTLCLQAPDLATLDRVLKAFPAFPAAR